MDCAIFSLKGFFYKWVKKISEFDANKKLIAKEETFSVNACYKDRHKFYLKVFVSK